MEKRGKITTEFEERIYALTRRVPRGCVTTYGLLAAAAGCGSAQAVGQALKRNPYAPEVPCHRVIASDLTLGGFLGKRAGSALQKKIDLLKREGVQFSGGKLVDDERVFNFVTMRKRVSARK